MNLRPASARIFPGFFLLVILALGSSVQVNAAPGKEGAAVAPQPGPVLEVKFQEEVEKAAAPAPAVSLDPFYLIDDKASQARVKRVLVALEFLQPEKVKEFDPRTPRLREIVYDFLVSQVQADPARELKEQEKILAGLVNGCLGQETVSAVKLDQSYVLLQ